MGHWLFKEEHEMFRNTVRKFIEKEIKPNVEQWEREGQLPKSLYKRFAELGLLGIKFPVEYGGLGMDLLFETVFQEELKKCGSGGVGAAVGSHIGIALTAIAKYGNHNQKKKYLEPGIKGEIVAALAITEPNTGSDVSSIATYAVDEGDYYLLNGAKTFITSGVNADIVVVAAKTKQEPKYKNISLFIVETKSEGFKKGKKLKKLGWRASDTAQLFFENVKVPKENLIGNENEAFKYIMKNFQWERILMAISSVAQAEVALEAAIQYSKERFQFGQPLANFQVLRHKMADMAIDIEKAKSISYRALYLYLNGEDAVTETTMAKAYAGEMVRRVTDQALQIFGGNGYMMEFPVQRYWRDARIQSIGGGTTQIMNEILSKRLGIVTKQ